MKRAICRTLFFVVLFGMGCSQPPPGKGQGEIAAAQSSAGGVVQFRVETVASGLEVPWAIAFPPDGRIFFTERPGRVRVIEEGRLRAEPLATISDVEPRGESGLMDLSLHPQFADNRLLYLAYAYRGDGQRVRVVRFRESGGTLAERTVIIENIPAARYHAGTRVTGAGAQRAATTVFSGSYRCNETATYSRTEDACSQRHRSLWRNLQNRERQE